MAMRRVLVDHARTRNRDKRGGGRERTSLDAASDAADHALPTDIDLLALDGALRRLEQLDPR